MQPPRGDWTSQFFALVCEHDPGLISADQELFPPAGCASIDRGAIHLLSTDGALLDSCYVGLEWICNLSGATDSTFIIEFVGGSVSSDYVARDNPNIFAPDQTINAGIVFVPTAELDSRTETAEVVFHARDCPLDYAGENYFNDCHDRLPEFRQVIVATGPTVRSAVTGEDGNIAFSGLPAGTWRFEPSLPRNTSKVSVFCSDSDSRGVELDRYSASERDAEFLVDIQLDASDDIVCDLYRIPTTLPKPDSALLTLRLKSCQKLETPAQIYADCFSNLGESMFQMGNDEGFFIDGYTGPGGKITLELAPGSYWASGVYGHNIAATYTYCSEAGDPVSGVETIPHLSAGEHWTCDIYIKRESFR